LRVREGVKVRERGRRATVRGVYALDLRAGFGGDELIVDEEADGLGILAAVGRCEGDGEVGHDVRMEGEIPMSMIRFKGG